MIKITMHPADAKQVPENRLALVRRTERLMEERAISRAEAKQLAINQIAQEIQEA
jgi:hypothetical protein